jgi:hypothetical protein
MSLPASSPVFEPKGRRSPSLIPLQPTKATLHPLLRVSHQPSPSTSFSRLLSSPSLTFFFPSPSLFSLSALLDFLPAALSSALTYQPNSPATMIPTLALLSTLAAAGSLASAAPSKRADDIDTSSSFPLSTSVFPCSTIADNRLARHTS